MLLVREKAVKIFKNSYEYLRYKFLIFHLED